MVSKVTLQRGTAIISVEGDNAFVEKTLLNWKHLLEAPPPAAHSKIDPDAAPIKAGGSGMLQFENVYDTVDGKIKLIHSMPGANKADKTRSTALALLYGHYIEGSEQIPSELIREACVDQGCFDQGNFAANLKGLKEKVAMNTKAGGGYDVKLTAPGRKAAKELVEGLNIANS